MSPPDAYDETGLVYYNYRYYSPVLGRWTRRDPIGENGEGNLYAILSNRMGTYDKLGLVTWNNEQKISQDKVQKIVCILKALSANLGLWGIGENLMYKWLKNQSTLSTNDNMMYSGTRPGDSTSVYGEANIFTGSIFINQTLFDRNDWANIVATAIHEATHVVWGPGYDSELTEWNVNSNFFIFPAPGRGLRFPAPPFGKPFRKVRRFFADRAGIQPEA